MLFCEVSIFGKGHSFRMGNKKRRVMIRHVHVLWDGQVLSIQHQHAIHALCEVDVLRQHDTNVLGLVAKYAECNDTPDSVRQLARDWDGLVLDTEEGTYVQLLISNHKACCEDWSFSVERQGQRLTFDGQSFANEYWNHVRQSPVILDLLGATITAASWDVVWEQQRKQADNDSDNVACIRVSSQQSGEWHVTFKCYHGGYYAHDVRRVFGNIVDSQEL